MCVPLQARDVGGGFCGGFVFFAGGDAGKSAVDTVTVYPANVSTPALQKKTIVKLNQGLRSPKVRITTGRIDLWGFH